MKKESVKSFILGATLATALFAFPATSLATPIATAIQATYNDIQLIVDGVKVDFGKDSKGQKIEPFIYNGTTYLPVRSVGESLGKDVGWDGATKTVYIGKKNVSDKNTKYIGNGIDVMNYQEGTWDNNYRQEYNNESYIKDNVGNKYNNYLTMHVDTMVAYEDCWSFVEYPTNAMYSTFQATVALTEEEKSTSASFNVEVFADDKLVYEKSFIAGAMPEDINVPINNALKVKIKTSKVEGGEYEIGFFNPRFVE